VRCVFADDCVDSEAFSTVPQDVGEGTIWGDLASDDGSDNSDAGGDGSDLHIDEQKFAELFVQVKSKKKKGRKKKKAGTQAGGKV